ncbi:prephenate dehydrogenase/arogenate dehydrogenase family protein [Nonomuraea monospora]
MAVNRGAGVPLTTGAFAQAGASAQAGALAQAGTCAKAGRCARTGTCAEAGRRTEAGTCAKAGACAEAGASLEAGATVPADVVVIATPPSAVVPMLRWAQERRLGVLYTDVASVKARLLAEAEAAGCDLESFVPGHPMAGRESSGPAAASADLFEGRPWAVCHHPALSPHAVRAVTTLVTACGARVVPIEPEDHDRAAAAVSHAPHVVSSTLAARFAGSGEGALVLAGRGLLDVTRVAGGPSGLWRDILEHNAEPVADVLEAVADDLNSVVAALRSADPALLGALTDVLGAGNAGRSRIVSSWPGTAGGPHGRRETAATG